MIWEGEEFGKVYIFIYSELRLNFHFLKWTKKIAQVRMTISEEYVPLR